MNPINPTSRLGELLPSAATYGQSKSLDVAKSSFADVLSGLVKDVNGLQASAAELRDQLVAGEGGELHQVMIAAEEAGIALELLIEVRNKIIEAYQELMRMPV